METTVKHLSNMVVCDSCAWFYIVMVTTRESEAYRHMQDTGHETYHARYEFRLTEVTG